ncbi:hypothetical protein V0U79_09145 [Hyphobacterium sp. HN65]|uniref:Uncharacterized protein n=1 Tax=Hyphobacterium lacteum TaxID=3116575 RepID=A0ABU7LSB2_9PROT|nr:hypothetical protein [Hyphobacterium sp. HN65]MEE2526531.1 hypothetical protein [Hyphobacterium sp. HN65]
MLRILAGGIAVIALSATASAQTAEEIMTERCVAEGNAPEQCSCAAEVITDTLEDNEVRFMLTMMQDPPESMEALLSVAAEHSLDLEGIAGIREKMTDAEPGMREQCGIEDAN